MRRIFTSFFVASIVLLGCNQAQKKERYTADWESIKQYQIPEWFADAKFLGSLFGSCLLFRVVSSFYVPGFNTLASNGPGEK